MATKKTLLPLTEIFSPEGALSRQIKGFEYRPHQLQMAEAIAYHIEEKGSIIVEGETGLGKTLAYLASAVLAGKKTIVSTYTKTLQEQICFKDIPLLKACLGKPISAVMVKGRANYICSKRFHANKDAFYLSDGKLLGKIESWLQTTLTGDLEEIDGLAPQSALWQEICSDREHCAHKDCLYSQWCFFNKLRMRLADYDLIIVNHHLFFSDFASGGNLLPDCDVTIFDEAQYIDQVAGDCLSLKIDNIGPVKLMRYIAKVLDEHDPSGDIKALAENVVAIIEKLFVFFARPYDQKYRLYPARDFSAEALCVYSELREALMRLKEELLQTSDSKQLAYLADKVLMLEEYIQIFFEGEHQNYLLWSEQKSGQITLWATPVDLAEEFQKRNFFGNTFLFISATLSIGGSFDYFKSNLGIGQAHEMRFASHFDYARRALMYIPRDIAEPARGHDTSFQKRLADLAAHIECILKITRGRALLLFTSLNLMQKVYEQIKTRSPYPLLMQGEHSKGVLLKLFRNEVHSVLFASNSFWQGVDLPGDTLSCVIIDKIPFPVPDDPVIQARAQLIRQKGGDPFKECFLPSAAIAIKQGFGRLLRASSDRGVFCLLDPRARTRSYGAELLKNLQDIPLSDSLNRIQEFFDKHEG